MRTQRAVKILNVALIVFFAVFFVLPVLFTVKGAFIGPDGGFSLDYVGEVFANPIYREGLWNSLVMAVWSTLGCMVVALPLAMLYVRCQFPGRGLLNSLMLLPMVLPPFVGAIGIKAMLGPMGAVNSFFMGLGLMDEKHPVDWLGEGQMLGIVVAKERPDLEVREGQGREERERVPANVTNVTVNVTSIGTDLDT